MTVTNVSIILFFIIFVTFFMHCQRLDYDLRYTYTLEASERVYRRQWTHYLSIYMYKTDSLI
jgi:hypothetical protein